MSSIYFYGYLNNQNIQDQISVQHLVFNTLMSFPDKALSENNNLSSIFDETKLTIFEFEKILKQLYNNDYILIDIYDAISLTKNNKKSIPNFPKNKTPVVMHFDNVTYKSNYQNLGEIDKIIIDRNNNLATYTTKKSIQDRIAYDNEFILILENFISEHPDFSINNAKGVINFSGENGILGYNTNHKNASHKNEIKRVSSVIKKLKSNGWKFGCNNYTYQDETIKTDLEFAKELSLWNKEIKPIIGNTDLYAHPYGNFDNKHTQKKELLLSDGFKVFFENDTYSSTEFIDDMCIIKRIDICGKTLRNNYNELSHLFNSKEVYDTINRKVPFDN